MTKGPTKTPEDLPRTGNCYENCLAFLIGASEKDGWTLVHGRPTLQRFPFVEFGHAWLERGDTVHDPSTDFTGPRFVYYALGRINPEHSFRYTRQEAFKKAQAFQHYGPWEGVDAEPPMQPRRRRKRS